MLGYYVMFITCAQDRLSEAKWRPCVSIGEKTKKKLLIRNCCNLIRICIVMNLETD